MSDSRPAAGFDWSDGMAGYLAARRLHARYFSSIQEPLGHDCESPRGLIVLSHAAMYQ
jgi:hypothetical protein